MAIAVAGHLAPAVAQVAPPPWPRTEVREPCTDFNLLRSPYFGDLHVHTSFSHDAYLYTTRVDPHGAYDFAKGGTVTLSDPSGAQTRTAQLDRRLDFAAVTDHAEFFGEVRICTTPGTPGFDAERCVQLREISDPGTEAVEFILWGAPLGPPDPPPSHDFCFEPGVDCDAAAVSVWQEMQAAAEGAYDRSAVCAFTSFIGYEHTASPSGSHLHRNVIFRNERVPDFATSYLETGAAGAPQPLWSAIETDCLNAGEGCDAVTIPHNSNLSGGLRWPDPADADDAQRRQALEVLVEIHQHKANSECRFDRLAGLGAGTTDELCAFEQDPRSKEGPFLRPPINQYPRRNLVRNVLKDGVAFEQSLGINPFKLGFIGSTDTHNSTPGNTEETDWEGHGGNLDADAVGKLSADVFAASNMRSNPGGLAVVWAEENSRDAIFEALKRRETYATSGTRPAVRFFAGRYSRLACGGAGFLESAYKGGIPMGGTLGAVRGGRSPDFAVLAVKDPGTATLPGTDLQRVQIVKGWVDQSGETHEQVFDVAGDANNGATVDPVTCAPVGTGFGELCTIWRDPTFDRDQHAFYYVRVLENPTCRWSTLVCKSAGVDPLSPDCATQAAAAGAPFGVCCLDETNDPFMEPVIQERAWSSPIWYRPEDIARLKANVRFGNEPGEDVLKLAVRIGRVPAEFDVTTEDLTVSVTDDDEIYSVTIPAGTLEERSPGRFVLRDGTGDLIGLRFARLTIRKDGKGRLKLRTGRLDLSSADPTDHMARVKLGIGNYQASHTRLWVAKGNRLGSS
jgi:hypothetical protein